jgi:nicotinamide mononucleotide (NMN) deamidase PncC
MSDAIASLVASIHRSGHRIVMAVTGGGSGAIASLFGVPGASQSMLLAAVPYAEPSLVDWLGATPEQFCSEATARAMAMAAYQRARQFDPKSATLVGLGATASLASNRPKRGPHRIYIATQTASSTSTYFVELTKGCRTRTQEEALSAACILNELAATCEVAAKLSLAWQPEEQPAQTRFVASQSWQDLLAGTCAEVCVGESPGSPRVLLPGAFNPYHLGHRQMAEIARQLLSAPVEMELSITNVDKPPLDFLEIDRRLRQFIDGQPVRLTRAPTFAEKARLFPGVTFVVGADTLERIAQPRYYQNSIAAMLRAIESIALAGCRFLVFGRSIGGCFHALEDLELPPSLRALCQEVPESAFRNDISSTQLRQEGGV